MTSGDRFILGFSDSVHDRSVCLFQGAEPIVAIEEERLTRQRYGLDFIGHDIKDAAVYSKLDLDSGKGTEHTDRLQRLVDYCLHSADITESDISLWIGNSLHTAFPFIDRAVFMNHHLAHAASAFYGSDYGEAAVLVLDGYGDSISGDEFETVSIYRGSGAKLELIHQVTGAKDGLHLSHSAGIFYRIGTLLSGFGVVDEGKAMGLAGYGRPRHLDRIMEYIRFGSGRVEIANDTIWKALQAERSEPLEARADMAASFQAALEHVVLYYARLARELTGCDVLCMAGGVALNCVANQKVLQESGFRAVSVFPAAADNGISFGAAYYGAHAVFGYDREPGLKTPCLGQSYSRAQKLEALRGLADVDVTETGLRGSAERAAHEIAAGRLVMWFQEGSEIGPRALGHRSLFGDPRSVDTRDQINSAVKSRESFRPLAPLVLEEEAGDWFECGRSPYMLFTPPVRQRTRDLAPGVVHADGTARVQTLRVTDNPAVHGLVTEFRRLTGVPMVINTSFNLRGEPIVETPLDAVRAFAEAPVPVLCIDGFYVTKRGTAGGLE